MRKFFICVLLGCLIPKLRKQAFRTINAFKRELASGKISDFFYGLETPPVIRSQLKLESMFFAIWNTSQLILAKIGVPPDGKNPVQRRLVEFLVFNSAFGRYR